MDQPQGAAVIEPADVTRQRIDREREALKSTLLKEQQACRQGFWVNACLSEAQSRYSQALKPLQQQQRTLEQARRQQLGAQARQRVLDKQAAQEERSLQADRSSSQSVEPSKPQSVQAVRQSQARERALKQQREAPVDQRQPDQGTEAPQPTDAQAEKPVR